MRQPRLLLTEGQVRDAVLLLLGDPNPSFVFDLETTGLSPQTDDVVWVGLGSDGCNFLIPCGHDKGAVVERSHKEQEEAWKHFGLDSPLAYTPATRNLPPEQRKLSRRRVDFITQTKYATAPKQLRPFEVAKLIEPLLFSDRAIVGHNLKFDLKMIAQYYGGRVPPGPYHDTIVLQHVIDEAKPSYGLKELSISWFAPKDPKTWYPSLGSQGIEHFGLDEIARYLAKDLRYCWYLFTRLQKKLAKHPELRSVYEFEMSMYPLLIDMELAGFPIDLSALGRVGEELDAEKERIEVEAGKLCGDRFVMSSLANKRYVLFGEREKDIVTGERKPVPVGINGVPLKPQSLKALHRTAKTDAPQLNQAVLAYYAERGNRVAELMLEWSKMEKLRGTFVVGLRKFLVERDDRIPALHTSFKQHGTVTGRFSAEKPNLHQIPKGSTIRDLFIAGPGHVLIVADYDQIELRCAGRESGDRNMLKVFRRGDDVHRQAAAAMYGISQEEITDDQRHVGKTQNFAVLYGAGPNKIANVAHCTKLRAQQLIEGYYALFTGLEPWKKEVLREARSRFDPTSPKSDPPFILIPPVGRLRRLPDLMEYRTGMEMARWRAERQAINALVQGFASYITKLAMLDLYDKLQPYPAKMLIQVHDEIIVRSEESYADDVLGIVVESMSGIKDPQGDPILGDIPLLVSAKVGYSWAAAKGK